LLFCPFAGIKFVEATFGNCTEISGPSPSTLFSTLTALLLTSSEREASLVDF